MTPEPFYRDDLVTLYHGDCREVLLDLDGNSVDAVITDPPYGVDRHGLMLGQIAPNYHGKGAHTRGYASHHPERFRELLLPVTVQTNRLLRAGRLAAVFGSTRTLHEMAAHVASGGLTVLDVLAFVGGPSFAKSTSTLTPAYEPMVLARAAGRPYQLNPRRNISNVVTLPKGRRRESAHPTTKPLSWMLWLVDLLTEPGELVLDPFAGSGSTLLAAQRAGRRAIGIEVDERYCALAAQRLALPR